MGKLFASLISRKSLMVIAIVALLGGAGWYVKGTIEERNQLASEVQTLHTEKAQAVDELEHRVEEFQKTIEGYDASMSHYVEAVADSDKSNQRLKYQLERLENETLAECMSAGVDAEFLDRVFDYPTNRHTKD